MCISACSCACVYVHIHVHKQMGEVSPKVTEGQIFGLPVLTSQSDTDVEVGSF